MRVYRQHLAAVLMIFALIGSVFSALHNSGTAIGYPSSTEEATPTPPSGTPSLPSAEHKRYFPLFLINYPPTHSVSYYVGSLDYNAMYALGQAYGNEVRNRRVTQHMVLLAFGTPGTNGGVQGAWMTRNKGHVPVFTASALAQQYLLGWLNGTANTNHHLWLAFGVNNYDVPEQPGNNVTTINAQGWSSAMAYARATVPDPRAHWVFAIDSEQDWNSYAITKAYQDAYMNGQNGCTPGSGINACLYNFGTSNCGYSGTNQNCQISDWDKDDIWYLSGGQKRPGDNHPFAAALPEIYNTGGFNALQWQSVSLYGATTTGKHKLYFVGALTTLGACQQVGLAGCSGFDNAPPVGYHQLYQHLAANSLTSQFPIHWSTDIKYQVYP